MIYFIYFVSFLGIAFVAIMFWCLNAPAGEFKMPDVKSVKAEEKNPRVKKLEAENVDLRTEILILKNRTGTHRRCEECVGGWVPSQILPSGG